MPQHCLFPFSIRAIEVCRRRAQFGRKWQLLSLAHSHRSAPIDSQSTAAVHVLLVAPDTRQSCPLTKASLSFILFFEMLLQIDFRPLKSLNLIRLIIIDIISIAFGDSTAEREGHFSTIELCTI